MLVSGMLLRASMLIQSCLPSWQAYEVPDARRSLLSPVITRHHSPAIDLALLLVPLPPPRANAAAASPGACATDPGAHQHRGRHCSLCLL